MTIKIEIIKNMKTIIAYAYLLLVISVSIGCEDVMQDDPENETDRRDAITGTWQVSEYSETFKEQYFSVEIKKDDNSEADILMYNFFNLSPDLFVKATITESKLVIPEQEVDNNTFVGAGTISASDKDIEINYTVDFGNGPEEVSSLMTTRPIAMKKDVVAINQ